MFEDDDIGDYDMDVQLSPERGRSPPTSPFHGFPSPTGPPSSDASAVLQSEGEEGFGEGMSQSSVQVFCVDPKLGVVYFDHWSNTVTFLEFPAFP